MTPEERLARLEVRADNLAKEIKLRIDAHHAVHDLMSTSLVDARETVEHRLNVLNDFSARMSALEGTFATKENVDFLVKAAEDQRLRQDKRIGDLETANSNMQGRLWALGAALTFGLSALTFALRFI